jgi:hypothetical protein
VSSMVTIDTAWSFDIMLVCRASTIPMPPDQYRLAGKERPIQQASANSPSTLLTVPPVPVSCPMGFPRARIEVFNQ